MIGLSLLAAACAEGPFDAEKARSVIEAQPIQLDGEQIAISLEAVTCGQRNELWTSDSLGDRSVARLAPAARNLQFYDDVRIGDPDIPVPHAQVRGNFRLKVLSLGAIRDESEQVKVVEAKLAVLIDHPCFQNPVPQLLAVRRGNFTPDAMSTVRFRHDPQWTVDRILH
jgi:hypothetical protein